MDSISAMTSLMLFVALRLDSPDNETRCLCYEWNMLDGLGDVFGVTFETVVRDIFSAREMFLRLESALHEKDEDRSGRRKPQSIQMSIILTNVVYLNSKLSSLCCGLLRSIL